ncbi:choice-of-anchor H family protein [Shewanella sp. 10N.286.54.B9]|uniref:choice-of-anchor H family protein n=1 Tax=Shewanella sp. 10N.286.54.B9 TaxID=3229719 RepID=UPI00354F8A63
MSQLTCQTKRLSLIVLFLGALLPVATAAQELGQTLSSSAGYKMEAAQSSGGREKAVLTIEQQELLLQQRLESTHFVVSKQSREQVIQGHIDKALKADNQRQHASSPALYANSVYRDFYIYDAYSRLFVDNDFDGFYQTFSVTFDADVSGSYVNETANVFAELYLSRNGGPWEHYYTTDIFTIFGDATDDDYEVLTTLESGYTTDHYDVLIDLYEVGYGDIVATVSSNDFDSLYALPLESRYWDEEYIEIETEHGGTMSQWGILVLLILGLTRRYLTLRQPH